MLEWTICEKCGKILDNSQELCNSCDSPVEKIDMDYFTQYFSNTLFLVKTLEVFKDYCPSLKDLNNASIESIVIDDMFQWFSYLGLGDGEITDNELEFINSLLNTNYSKEDILSLSDIKLDNNIPLSFKCLKELDSFGLNLDMNGLNSCAELLSCYKLFGMFFITVDNKLDEDVLSRYTKHISYLQNSLDIQNEVKMSEIFTGRQEESNCPDVSDENLNDEQEESHSLDEYLEELNKLVGLEKVKKDVNSLINLVRVRKIRKDRGIKQPAMSLHLVFSGNPGTGKTTVARLLSKIYHEIGLLSKGHLIETDRSGLVGGYVGQTAIKTKEVIDSAVGGILFIDEAYSLASKSENDYGLEAIDTLLKAMEDMRDDLIVIVAGYPVLMDNFLNSNPGLESRFNKFIFFEDYNEEELYDIFISMCDNSSLSLDDGAKQYLKEYFKNMYEHRSSNFANGRAVRNFFEEVISNQANRLATLDDISDEELNTLTYEDFLVD